MLQLHVYNPVTDRKSVTSYDDPADVKEPALAALQAGHLVQLTGPTGKRPRIDDIDSVRIFSQENGSAVTSGL